ncbi:unnamed protein product [Brassica oleracea]
MSSRCSAVDNMGMVNRDVEADDELKSCSCSFCLKGFCLIDYSTLMSWVNGHRSLFLNMEGILAPESSHLQDSFVAIKELRENCKIDLERATKTPQRNNTWVLSLFLKLWKAM